MIQSRWTVNQTTLVRIVRDGLDDAAPKLASSDWANVICEPIEERLKKFPDIECAFGRSKAKPEDRREWLWDFIAFQCNHRSAKRYLMQALIVGEIESSNNFAKDFEKLMATDAFVCFFAFPGWNSEDTMETYQAVAKSRREHALLRGLNPPPIFILASHTAGKFTYRFEPEDAAPT